MKEKSLWIACRVVLRKIPLAIFCGLFIGQLFAEDSNVEKHPLDVGAYISFMQIFNVEDSLLTTPPFEPTVTLPQTTLWMLQRATVNERWSFALGIAGSFFYPFPEEIDKGWTSYRLGGLAISQASGSYSFGDLEASWLKVTVGQQGYKYNTHSKNLGEYLLRSDPYPTVVKTGDWGAIANASAGIWGVLASTSFLDGMLGNDVLITLSNERLPLHDVSVSDIVSLSFMDGLVQLGGGVRLNSLVQIDPNKSRFEHPKTGYFEWTANNQAQLSNYLSARVLAGDSAIIFDTTQFTGSTFIYRDTTGVITVDTSLVVGQTYWANSKRPVVDFLTTDWEALDPSVRDSLAMTLRANVHSQTEYIDQRTIMLMGRAALDFQSVLNMNFQIYTEVAVLGWDNYPIYYTARSQRQPLMLGINLPTFGFLDYLTLEFEWMKNPHMNSDFIPALFRTPVPKSVNGTLEVIPAIADPVYDTQGTQDQYRVEFTDDDFKWSVSAQKSFGVWGIAGQFARDHYRPLNSYFRPNYTEATLTKDSWYYIVRLLVNL